MILGASPSHAKLELRVLGAGEVWQGNQRLLVGHRKTLALLAFLALEGESARSTLTTLFWSDNTEEAARRNLRRELHRLREAGLRDFLEASHDHLRLVGLTATDVQQFEALIAEGRLERALLLWRGELLAGLRLENAPEFEVWLEARRESLASTLRKAQLEVAERLEVKGDWHAALKLNQQVLQANRLQERQHREVMRLQYLLGQREAALAQFEDCKSVLREELGLEPLPATLHLAQQIRAAQSLTPDIAVQIVATQQLIVPLIGRERALTALSSSSTALTLVLAEGGGGKTFLLERFAPHSLRVRFRAVSSQTPLYAVGEAIREGMSRFEAKEKFNALEPIWQLEAARLVPELSRVQSSQAQERSLLLEGLARVLECLTDQYLILEDLHWADSASLELIAHLVRRSARANQQPQLIATARGDELSDETRQLLDALTKEGFSTSITLTALSQIQVSELVRSLGGPIIPAFSSQLFKVTAGNPFFILETIRFLFEQNELELKDETWVYNNPTLPIPPSVREAVLKRIDKAGSATRRLLETAALTDDGFTLETLQSATALNEWESLEGIEQAVQAEILKRFDRGFGFTHEITRAALQTALSAERKRLIHRKLASTLEQNNANPASIAMHLEQAEQAEAAIPWRIRAAENATRVYAHTQALEQYDQAIKNGADAFSCHNEKLKILQVLDQPKPILETIKAMQDIAIRSGKVLLVHQAKLASVNYQRNIGNYAQVMELTHNLLEQPNLSPEHRSKALFERGIALLRQGKLSDADFELQKALEQNQENTVSAKIQLIRCQIAARTGNLRQAQEYAQQSLSTFIAFNDPLGQTEALQALGNVFTAQGDVPKSIKHHMEGLMIAERTQNLNFLRPILMNLVISHIRLKEVEAAGAYLEKVKALPTQSLDPQSKYHFHYCVGHHAQLSGQLGSALENFEIQVQLTNETENPAAKIRSRLSKVNVYRYCGAYRAALETLNQASEICQEHQLQEYSLEILLEQIRCEMQLPNQSIDISILEQFLADNQNPEDHLLTQMIKVEYFLHHKNPKAAQQHLETIRPWKQMEVNYLSLQLQIMIQNGKPDPKLLAQARSLTLTPYEALEFQKIHANALESNKQLEEATQLRASTKECMLMMAGSLADYPDLKKSFLELHANLL